MKYIFLPVSLIKFWYPDSINFFIRTWKNLILYLEEDLAVGLMLKLIFTPLFHDSTIVGRILSFIFRLSRIFIGLFAFTIASVILLLIGGYWFILPAAAIFDQPTFASRAIFLGGVGIFLINLVSNPHKKVWLLQPKDKPISADEIMYASKIKRKDLSFGAILKTKEVEDILSNLEVQLNGLPYLEITDVDGWIKDAFELGKRCQSQYLTAGYFFVAGLNQFPNIDKILLKFELKVEDFVETLAYLEKKKNTWRQVFIWDDDFSIHHLKGVNRGWLGVPTPNLDLVSTDLTKEAASKFFSELRRENGVTDEVIHILSQQSGRNVILVGAPGSGKTAFLRYLAKLVVAGDAPEALATKRIVLLDLTKLLSGVKNQGDLAEKVKVLFEEVEFTQNVIIAIEEIHELGMGEVGNQYNLYSLMQPYLESDSFQFIGTTEGEYYNKILEKNASFLRLFRKIELDPATEKDSLSILEDRAIEAEKKNKIKITYVALKTAVSLSVKLIHDRVLPDSAIAVFKESLTQPVSKWVTKEVIRRVISQRVKVPLMEIGSVDKDKLLALEQEIHSQLIDQEPAVKAVSDTLRRSVTGLREEGRPIGSFLFVGPTGVGKTELAKTLAKVYFRDIGAFIRFDMSEYQNPESVERLIGSKGEGGILTESVKTRPYALLLLDEFEKANPKILTLFLQVLDDGRLTDGAGRTISFDNTIIIATSNAGSLTIAQQLGAGKTLNEIEQNVTDELLKIFKPELVNRFDEVVLFKPLSSEDLQKVVIIKLAALQNQMKEKGYLIEFNEGLIGELSKRGFDPVLGARPLRRLIQDTLEANLSKLILQNELVKGQVFQAGADLLSS